MQIHLKCQFIFWNIPDSIKSLSFFHSGLDWTHKHIFRLEILNVFKAHINILKYSRFMKIVILGPLGSIEALSGQTGPRSNPMD